MYNTGDLCRWLDNGTIEPLGRVDDQVKIKVLTSLFSIFYTIHSSNATIGVQDRACKRHHCYRGKNIYLILHLRGCSFRTYFASTIKAYCCPRRIVHSSYHRMNGNLKSMFLGACFNVPRRLVYLMLYCTV